MFDSSLRINVRRAPTCRRHSVRHRMAGFGSCPSTVAAVTLITSMFSSESREERTPCPRSSRE
eukprot:13064616-Alexandrium_andersonii.AAC.1